MGAFTGRVEYTAAGPGSATLTVELWNTSPAANGGFLTAFALDNPSGRITGAALSTTNPNFSINSRTDVNPSSFQHFASISSARFVP